MTLQGDLHQTRPFTSPHEEALLAVRRTAEDIGFASACLFREWDITPAQYNVLRILRGAGSSGIASSEIGERMINRDPDVTKLIDRLEDRGLAERERCKPDRRVVWVKITPQGMEMVNGLDMPLQRRHFELMGDIPGSSIDFLIEILETIRTRCATVIDTHHPQESK